MCVVMLFGAGASAFSDDRSRTPPLGNELFDRLILEGGPAASLSEAHVLAFRTTGFEPAMAQILEVGTQHTVDFVRQVAAHLFNYRAGPNNTYLRLLRAIQPLRKRVLLASLNYDTLLEQALVEIGFQPAYNPAVPYLEGTAPVLKLHGSSNWLPMLPSSVRVFAGNSTTADSMLAGNFVSGLEMAYTLERNDFQAWASDSRHSNLTPVLSLYARGKKGLVNNNFLEQLQQSWGAHVALAQAVLLIGVRFVPEDTHIWEPLARSRATLLVVDPEPNAVLCWAEYVGRPARAIAGAFSSLDSIVEAVVEHG